MVAHHLGTLLAVTSSIVTGECHMHAAWMLLTEATTPFINMRWWLEKSVSMHSRHAQPINQCHFPGPSPLSEESSSMRLPHVTPHQFHTFPNCRA
jgi:hypothetical protein